jgi:hypothetical protein
MRRFFSPWCDKMSRNGIPRGKPICFMLLADAALRCTVLCLGVRISTVRHATNLHSTDVVYSLQ